MPIDLGDFQTPAVLARSVVACLRRRGTSWSRALEPTCGEGSFVAALLEDEHGPPCEIIGIELQGEHVTRARSRFGSEARAKVRVDQGDVFDPNRLRCLSWADRTSPLLVIGNPPWVTNSAIGAAAGGNLPKKNNIKGLTGLDAMTGAANFDIAEYIILSAINQLTDQRPTMAFLCKTIVARNVIEFAALNGLPIANASAWRIDAKRSFGAAVDACLFVFDVAEARSYDMAVYANIDASIPAEHWGIRARTLVSDIAVYDRLAELNSGCELEWRQGIKHDAARVMEFRIGSDGTRHSDVGDGSEIESEYVFPLLKATALHHGTEGVFERAVLVTQRRIGDETATLAIAAPKLWGYLNTHRSVFEGRKSSIYRGRPPFSIFGVGSYSFAPFKVAVSGLHADPRFRLVAPLDGKPVMLDDTCYFLPCDSLGQAAAVMSVLNAPPVQAFLHALSFRGNKRPITKKVLQRVSLAKAARVVGIDALAHTTASILTVRDETFDPASTKEIVAGIERLASPPPKRSATQASLMLF
jgi:hypothetical protein